SGASALVERQGGRGVVGHVGCALRRPGRGSVAAMRVGGKRARTAATKKRARPSGEEKRAALGGGREDAGTARSALDSGAGLPGAEDRSGRWCGLPRGSQVPAGP